MARPYEQYYEEDKGKLVAAFEEANPDYWKALQGRTQDIERVKEIARHTHNARAILEDTYREERQDRVARAAVEVWAERSQHAPYIAEQARAHLMNDNSILEESRKRVEALHEEDIKALQANEDSAAERLAKGEHLRFLTPKQEEIAAMTTPDKQSHFKAELHRIIDESAEARRQVSSLMNSERERLMEEAKQNGADDPQQVVKAFQSRMYKDAQDKLHKDVHALCIRYGYDSDRKQVQFLAALQTDEIDERALNEEADQISEEDQDLESNTSANIEAATDYGDFGEQSEVPSRDNDDDHGQ